MKENEKGQAGEDKGSVSQDKASKDGKPGELGAEELTKVAGGIGISWLNSNSVAYKPPTGNTILPKQ